MEVQLMGYDPDHYIWRNLVCNAAGKLIIDPSEILENPPTQNEAGKAPQSAWAFAHNANASAHHTRYTNDEARAAVGYNGTKWWSCPGIHFDASNPSIDNINKDYRYSLTINSAPIGIYASVILPQAAVINWAAVNGSVGGEASIWYLYRLHVDTLNINLMATNNINYADETINYSTVDNQSYAYFLYCEGLQIGDVISSGRIRYVV